ncbi:polysaccharide deacetylase family protein [Paenibacillus glycanilyticus]|uniref:polysaccharide deacetylase family protein n=1 Tax=Paenibacillus glycanilyticus TaxID=126569 RepID=UPI00203A40DA|nr:polysaccharide deacetylase family protein [Paenibacillus glycanilyticus]MCM3625898.1 polysaccharide deacetylase family protein [Paenibacillus glycanilyticus]
MMRMRNKIIGLGASFIVLIVVFQMNAFGIMDYIQAIKGQNAVVTGTEVAISDEEKAKLRETIEAEAQQRYVQPIDARIDRVWKAIPGYNGLEVDIEKTYQQTIASGSTSPIQFVYKEISPKISLKDLGPWPIYKGNPNKKMISIMVNVAWGNEYLPAILDTFDKEHVKATFFLDGSWLKKYPDVAKHIQERGHEISNHAYSHPDMKTLSRQNQFTQISRTEDLLKSTLDVQNKWFAPPSGSYNQTTIQVASEQGLMTVMWTIDTVDWQKPSPDWIIKKISSKLEPGALILMHPTASSRDALTGMIREAKRQGYALGTVSETLSSDRLPSPVEQTP